MALFYLIMSVVWLVISLVGLITHNPITTWGSLIMSNMFSIASVTLDIK
jgi:hypothetical protein